MIVETILAQKGRQVHTILPDVTIADVIRQLSAKKVSALVVSVDGARPAGILSDRDVIRLLAERGGDALGERVGEVMTTRLITCRPGDQVSGLMHVMTEQRIRHIPVVDGDVLCGLVSIGDVVKHRVDEIQMEAAAMRDYIAGSR